MACLILHLFHLKEMGFRGAYHRRLRAWDHCNLKSLIGEMARLPPLYLDTLKFEGIKGQGSWNEILYGMQ